MCESLVISNKKGQFVPWNILWILLLPKRGSDFCFWNTGNLKWVLIKDQDHSSGWISKNINFVVVLEFIDSSIYLKHFHNIRRLKRGQKQFRSRCIYLLLCALLASKILSSKLKTIGEYWTLRDLLVNLMMTIKTVHSRK